MLRAFSTFLAFRYLLSRWINVLSIGGVAVAVWALILINAVFAGFVADIRADVRRSTPDLLVTDLPLGTGYERLRAVIARDQDVASVAPRLRHHGVSQPRTGVARAPESSEVEFNHVASGFVLVLGIDPMAERDVVPLDEWLQRAPRVLNRYGLPGYQASKVLEQDPERLSMLRVADEEEWNGRRRAGLPTAPRDEYSARLPGLLLGATRLRYQQRLQTGDPLDLISATFPDGRQTDPANPVQTLQLPFAFAGAFATSHRLFDENIALVPIEALRTMLGHDIADPGSIDLVTDVAIRLAPGLGRAAIAAVQRRLQQAVQAVLPAGAGPCSVYDWEQQNSVFLGAVDHEQKMMQFVVFVVMLLAAFLIYATLNMMVTQKIKDIGILAAIGGSPVGIGTVFLQCGLVVGVGGALLGCIGGVLSVLWLNPVNDWLGSNLGIELFPRNIFDLPQVPYRLEPDWIAAVATVALVLALLIAFLPARKAARLQPVEALSYE